MFNHMFGPALLDRRFAYFWLHFSEAAYIVCGVETRAYDISLSELYASNIPKNEARNKHVIESRVPTASALYDIFR
jgi:hypothetical protein